MPETKETFEKLKNYLDYLPLGLLLVEDGKNISSWNKEALNILEITVTDISNGKFGKIENQILELINSNSISERETIGLSKPYKIKKIKITNNDFLLIVSETFQETIGEMSHELRRPLTNIKTLCETLLMGAKDDPDMAGRFLENMNTEIDRLTKLVNELLNISKIKSGNLELNKKNISLNERVNDAVKLLQPIADKKNTKLIVELSQGSTIQADPEQIDHVIQNLIENAIKYSLEGSTVTIKNGPNKDSFQIDDTGIGIAPEQISKIFERFYQIDRTKAKGSSGLGLSIVKSIVDLHNGTIEVKSEPGKGSSFIINLQSE